MASRDQVRTRLLCRLAQANRVLELMIVGTRDGEAWEVYWNCEVV